MLGGLGTGDRREFGGHLVGYLWYSHQGWHRQQIHQQWWCLQHQYQYLYQYFASSRGVSLVWGNLPGTEGIISCLLLILQWRHFRGRRRRRIHQDGENAGSSVVVQRNRHRQVKRNRIIVLQLSATASRVLRASALGLWDIGVGVGSARGKSRSEQCDQWRGRNEASWSEQWERWW